MSINVNSAQASAGLLLDPMFIPGWRSPVQPAGLAHGGIPQSIYQAPNGLALVIDPFTMLTSFVLAAFDTVEVWLNGKPTSVTKTILPGDEQQRILMYLPLGLLVNGVNQLFYRVTRLSGNFEDSQPVLDVLYHHPAPGEPAPAGITIVFPPNIVANGVGPAEAAAGVPVTFIISFARQFDEIRLDVGTWSTTITVTDPAQPITRTLTTAEFQQIGDNANTPVKCTVTDQLGNGNQSATTYLNIHASQPDVVVAFLNGPYTVSAGGRVEDIKLSLTRAGQPIAGTVAITLPAGTTFADGAGGSRDFTAQADGKVSVSGVRAGDTAGIFSITASSGKATTTAELTIEAAHGPVRAIIVGPSPWGLALSPDGSRVYVPVGGKLQVIDTASSQLLAPKTVPELVSSWGMALTHNGTRAFVLNNSNILVVDLATSVVIARIPLFGTWIVPSTDGSKVFVSNYSADALAVIDTKTFQFTNIPVGTLPRQVSTSSDGSLVCVAHKSNAIAVVNARTLTVIKQIPLPSVAYGVVISPDGKYVYAGCGRDLIKLNMSTNSVVWTVPAITNRGLAVNRSGSRVYCCERDDASRVTTVDTESGQVVAMTQFPVGPMMMEISQSGEYCYVACLDSHIVSIASLASRGLAGSGVQVQGAGEPGVADIDFIPRELFPGGID